MIVVPGPSVLFVVSRALASGRRVAVWSVVGNALGEYVQVVAVAFGIGALAERSVADFTAIKLVGGAYLVYLGAKTYRQRKSLAKALATSPEQTSDRRSFAQGVTVGVTNPKTVVFLAAILPQFVDRAGGHVADQNPPPRARVRGYRDRFGHDVGARCGPLSAPGSPVPRDASSSSEERAAWPSWPSGPGSSSPGAGTETSCRQGARV